MGWHDSINDPIRTPPTVRSVMQMRTESLNNLFEIFNLAQN
jgi:hypothetical protein